MNGNVSTVIMSEEEFTENVNFLISNWYRDTGSCATCDNKNHIVSIHQFFTYYSCRSNKMNN